MKTISIIGRSVFIGTLQVIIVHTIQYFTSSPQWYWFDMWLAGCWSAGTALWLWRYDSNDER